jgi:hypothetical protein
MKYLNLYESFIKKQQDYKLINVHNRVIKKLNLDSTILSTKTIPIIGIYKLIKELLILDNISLSDEFLILIVIYFLTYILKLDLNLTKMLHTELENTIPNFKYLLKRFSLVINNLVIIFNISLKKVQVISGLEKMLNVENILEILDLITKFINEQKIGLNSFSFVIRNKKENVLKNLVEYINKNKLS